MQQPLPSSVLQPLPWNKTHQQNLKITAKKKKLVVLLTSYTNKNAHCDMWLQMKGWFKNCAEWQCSR